MGQPPPIDFAFAAMAMAGSIDKTFGFSLPHPALPLNKGRVGEGSAQSIPSCPITRYLGLLPQQPMGWMRIIKSTLRKLDGQRIGKRHNIFGAITKRTLWNSIVWAFTLLAFCIDLGEEIAMDAMDMESDKKRGSRSIALLRGKRFAWNIGLWSSSFLPIFWAGLG
jgi:hypothetical protein